MHPLFCHNGAVASLPPLSVCACLSLHDLQSHVDQNHMRGDAGTRWPRARRDQRWRFSSCFLPQRWMSAELFLALQQTNLLQYLFFKNARDILNEYFCRYNLTAGWLELTYQSLSPSSLCQWELWRVACWCWISARWDALGRHFQDSRLLSLNNRMRTTTTTQTRKPPHHDWFTSDLQEVNRLLSSGEVFRWLTWYRLILPK